MSEKDKGGNPSKSQNENKKQEKKQQTRRFQPCDSKEIPVLHFDANNYFSNLHEALYKKATITDKAENILGEWCILLCVLYTHPNSFSAHFPSNVQDVIFALGIISQVWGYI